MGTQENAIAKWAKIAQVVIALVAATAIPWCVWFTGKIQEMDKAISRLQGFADTGDRFTAKDGERLRLEMQAQSAAELAKVWQELAAVQTKWLKEISTLNTQIAMLPQTIVIPPKWWEDYVRAELARMDTRVTKLEAR